MCTDNRKVWHCFYAAGGGGPRNRENQDKMENLSLHFMYFMELHAHYLVLTTVGYLYNINIINLSPSSLSLFS